ncbi:MAG: alpha/beta hydrolase [Ferruginibacter sp.]
MKIYLQACITCIFLSVTSHSFSQNNDYPYPVSFFNAGVERTIAKMAYMDISPIKPNGKTIMLLHGKNFDGYYWKDVIPFLSDMGYRVIVPDQVGFGKSGKPNIHYSFHQMAANSKALLDSLGIKKVILIGHSMGGMLAIRFTLMYSSFTEILVLENPIGLEDYKTFVPYTAPDSLYKKELAATYESYKKYQQTYYPVWKPEYEQYVKEQAKALLQDNFPEIAWANALTYQVIYEQPVCYEFKNITVKTALIIGTADRTIVGKDRLTAALINEHGQYQLLGKQVRSQIKGSTLTELPAVGHIPHIQDLPAFKNALSDILKQEHEQ